MQLVEIINWSMILGTLFIHILFVFLILYWFFGKKDFFIFKILKNKGLMIAYLLSLAGMFGSLYYSEIAGYAPCVLCWYQRIFMYANVFILGLALYKGGDKNVIPYAMILSVVGGLVAVYHNLLFLPPFKNKDATCSPFSNVSCTENYFTALGYINIPLIAITTFVAIIILLKFSNKK
jgi:disulfide bond formation protein DsbB